MRAGPSLTTLPVVFWASPTTIVRMAGTVAPTMYAELSSVQ